MFPTDAGAELARELLESETPFGSAVDLTAYPPAMLISGFFQAFLQHVHDHAPTELARARKTEWIVKYDFQRTHITQWVRDFVPRS
jgi:hypothetical protein